MRKRYGITIALCALMAHLWASPAVAQAAFECTNNEAWLPVGDINGPATSAVVFNNELYVLHGTTGNIDALILSRWNGSAWSRVTDIGIVGSAKLLVHNNELYMYGNFQSIAGQPNTQGIVKWNGTDWEGLPGGDVASVIAATSYGGALYVSAAFTINGTISSGLAKWDGAAWNIVVQGSGEVFFPQDMVEWNGALYMAGGFSDIGGVATKGVARYDGTTWSAVGDPTMPSINEMFVHDDELYITNNTSVERLNGTTWEQLPAPSANAPSLYAFESFGGALYISAYIFTGPSEYRNTILRWDGSAWTRVSGFDLHVSFLKGYDGKLHAGGAFTRSCKGALSGVAWMCTTEECRVLSGVGDDQSNHPAADAAINAYPNPAGGTLSISSPLLKEGTMVTLRNMLGQSVASYRHNGSGVMEINTAALPAGTYLIAVRTAGGTATQRVTIVK